MRTKITVFWIGLFLMAWVMPAAAAKDVECQGKKLVSQRPPFSLAMPSPFQLMYSSALENVKENSVTRVYLFVKEKNKQAEEMFILQIADKTNPQALPISTPPLKAYTEKRMYQKDRLKKGDLTLEYLIQLMTWNPDAPSLQPVIEKGIAIPPHFALQGQFLFTYQGDHAVLVKYSKDVNSFGSNLSQDKKDWDKGSMSGNEKKTFEAFQKNFFEVVDSIKLKTP